MYLPIGTYRFSVALPARRVARTFSRVIDTEREKWWIRLGSDRSYSGNINGNEFMFSRNKPRSVLIPMQFTGKISAKDDENAEVVLKSRIHFLAIFLVLGLFACLGWTIWFFWAEMVAGRSLGQLVVATSVLGVFLVWFNSWFGVFEELKRTPLNFREKIENQQWKDEKDEEDTWM